MPIAVKKITDYRKIDNKLVEVHPKTEASQVITSSGSLDDAVINIAAKANTAFTATATQADGTTFDFSVTHPSQTAYPSGISSQSAAFGSSFNILSVKTDSTGHVTQIASAAVSLPALPDANASSAGIVKLSDSTSGTAAAASGKTAATPKAVSDALTAAKTYADGLVTAAMHYKGTVGSGGTVPTLPTSGVAVGDTYRVTSAGTYAGETCEVGDMIIALTTTPTWSIVQNNIDVFGSATASASGSIGMVPAPPAGAQNKVLAGNGTWVDQTANTDTKVTNTLATTSKAYVTGTTTATTNTGTQVFDTGVYLTSSAGEIAATNFLGKINGHTVSADVPADAVFTDTNTKVTQTVDTSSSTFPILAKNTTSSATVTDTARFAAGIKIKPSENAIIATTFSGALSGNASTATEFSANKTVQLTGDVTGSAASKAGWSVATTLSSTGVTSGSYGPSADASPAHGSSFSVPYFTVDAKGRVTSAATKTITLPADNNTDTKVTQTVTTTSAEYPLLAKATSAVSTVTDTARFAAAVTLNPSTGKITATEYNAFVVASAAPTDSTDISKLAVNGVYTYYYD